MKPLRWLIKKTLPKEWMAELERESRLWMLHCPACGTERSVWELGGIRYKGVFKGKRVLWRCEKCAKLKWFKVYKKGK